MGPLDDPLYLLQNAQCFKNISVSFKTQKKQKSKVYLCLFLYL